MLGTEWIVPAVSDATERRLHDAQVERWRAANACVLAECPAGCASPRAFPQGAEMWCGECYFVHGEIVRMTPVRA